MCLIHKQPVHAQLLESHHIILAALGLELFQPCLQRFLCAFQLFDRETLTAAVLHLGNAFSDLVDLLLKEPLLALMADGDFFKLRVANDDGIVVAGGDLGAELLPVVGLKVFLGRHQDFCRGIEPQKLRRPLLSQMIGNNEQGLLAQPQALGLHRSGNHLKSFARAHFVCQ